MSQERIELTYRACDAINRRAVLRFLGHGADSESPFDETVWHVSTTGGGKSMWWRVYAAECEALEAVGLSE
jgi:hypothetical protein